MKATPERLNLLPASASSFRLYLQTELARRCSTNAQYSLRSFALQLDVDHSTLSQLLRGKRRLTSQMVEKFGRRLNLPVEDIKAFADHEELMKAGETVAAGMAQQLTLDAVQLLSDTRHQSILELVRLDSFRPDVRWIARVLNTEADDVNIALSRLLRLGLLEMTTDRWLDKSENLIEGRNDFAASVIRKLSEQVHKLSLATTGEGTRLDEQLYPIRIGINKHQLESVLESIEKVQCNSEEDVQDGADERTYELIINRVGGAGPDRHKGER